MKKTGVVSIRDYILKIKKIGSPLGPIGSQIEDYNLVSIALNDLKDDDILNSYSTSISACKNFTNFEKVKVFT